MSRRDRLITIATVAPPAAVALFALATLPPRQVHLESPGWQGSAHPVVRGALHVHSLRSDGGGSVDEIAAAAARAGLQFVVLTDHGDGTRRPDPPTYREGVLCIDAVEISTSGGHLIAIDLPQAPSSIRGEPAAVAAEVTRLGGFGIVAHPESLKPGLRWRDWSTDFGGIEWLNADSQWRDEPIGRLLRLLLQYPWRPPETMASLLDRPVDSLNRFDTLTRRRRIVALGGSDSHARIDAWRGDDDPDRAGMLNFPSYEQSFRTFAIRVELDEPPVGTATHDAAALLRALKGGRVYTAIDALATPAPFEFSARSGDLTARMGDELRIDGPIALEARAAGPPGTEIALVRNGEVVLTTEDHTLRHTAPAEPAVFRVEVRLARAPGDPPIPWIVSNPIYVGGVGGESRAARGKRR